MASTYEGLKEQVKKIHGVIEKLTPPVPDDEFEAQRADALKAVDKLGMYLHNHIHGGGDA